MAKIRCSVCRWEDENGRKVDTSKSAETWASEVGVHRTSITRHLGHAPALGAIKDALNALPPSESVGASFDKKDNGDLEFTERADRVYKLSDWLQRMRDDGFDPDDYTHSIGHSVWGQNSLGGGLVTLYANRFTATLKTKKERENDLVPAVFESVLESIRSFTFVPTPKASNPASAIIMPADLQMGKVDLGGGSKETAAQALHSFHEFAHFVKEFRPAEICIVDSGDAIENIYNTSSQRETNDLDLPHQIAAASHVFLEGIKLLAPLTPKLRYAAVTSNHGAHRIGPKSPGGDAHADYGIVIAEMLRDSLTLNPEAFHHITVQTPEPYMESLYFQTSGTDIGVVHSHQAGNVDKIGDWWKGQSHGNLPTSQARILLCGHWHSARVQQSGDARWIFVGPASDRGSTWFTNLKGEQSQSGMLTFTTADNAWDNLRVL